MAKQLFLEPLITGNAASNRRNQYYVCYWKTQLKTNKQTEKAKLQTNKKLQKQKQLTTATPKTTPKTTCIGSQEKTEATCVATDASCDIHYHLDICNSTY